MDINIYSTDMIPLGTIDEITSFIWIRRYWKCGEFKLLVPFTERHNVLLAKKNLIMKRGGNEAAEIRYVHIEKNPQGVEEIEIQGKLLSCWLDKRLIVTPIIVKENTQNLLYRIVNENLINPQNAKRKIPNFNIAYSQDLGSGVIDYSSQPLISVLLACEDAAMAAKLGFTVTTNVRTGKHLFSVFKGRELTHDQTEYPPCTFSQEFDNVYQQEFTNSIENSKNVGYVGGEEKEGEIQIVAEVGSASGLERNEVYIDGSDIKQEYKENNVDIILTDAQYLSLLRQRGLIKIEGYTETLNFTSKVNTNINLIYGEDFDLGDRVTCIDKAWGVKINVRITEIEETYQEGKTDIDITFGESLPTLLEQIRRVR